LHYVIQNIIELHYLWNIPVLNVYMYCVHTFMKEDHLHTASIVYKPLRIGLQTLIK